MLLFWLIIKQLLIVNIFNDSQGKCMKSASMSENWRGSLKRRYRWKSTLNPLQYSLSQGDHAEAHPCMGTWQETKPPRKKEGDIIFMYTNVKMSRHVILSRGDEVFSWLGLTPDINTRKVLTPSS